MKKQSNKSSVSWYDTLAFTFAFIFTTSVILNIRDFVTDSGVLNSPATYAALAAALLVAYSWYKNKKMSLLANETMVCLVTSVAIWGFGLHGWLR